MIQRVLVSILIVCWIGSTISADEVKHFWDFEGNFDDKIGTANGTAGESVSTGTGHSGGTAMTTVADVTDAAGYVDIDTSGLHVPGSNAFSISYWVNIPVSSANRGIFDFSGDGGDGAQSLYRGVGANDDVAYRVDSASNSSSGSVAFVGSGVISDSNWHFIVGLYSPSGMEVHLDGFGVDGSDTYDGAVTFDPDSYLGAFNAKASSTNNGLNGALLDDLAIYDGLLSETDINDLFSGTKTPFDFQPVPEPSTGVLSGLILGCLLFRRLRPQLRES